jgi:hypothetical protein
MAYSGGSCYFQGKAGGSCYFQGAGMVTTMDPSAFCFFLNSDAT